MMSLLQTLAGICAGFVAGDDGIEFVSCCWKWQGFTVGTSVNSTVATKGDAVLLTDDNLWRQHSISLSSVRSSKDCCCGSIKGKEQHAQPSELQSSVMPSTRADALSCSIAASAAMRRVSVTACSCCTISQSRAQSASRHAAMCVPTRSTSVDSSRRNSDWLGGSLLASTEPRGCWLSSRRSNGAELRDAKCARADWAAVVGRLEDWAKAFSSGFCRRYAGRSDCIILTGAQTGNRLWRTRKQAGPENGATLPDCRLLPRERNVKNVGRALRVKGGLSASEVGRVLCYQAKFLVRTLFIRHLVGPNCSTNLVTEFCQKT